jgi:hypothetical protein
VSQPLLFAPLQNGLDYLESVVEHLRDNPDQRDLKYVILHLQAATEVLLKVQTLSTDILKMPIMRIKASLAAVTSRVFACGRPLHG